MLTADSARPVRSDSVYTMSAHQLFLTSGYAAIDQICDYYTTLHERDVKADVEPGYLLKQLPGMDLLALR